MIIETKAILEEYDSLVVEIPANDEEYNQRFSLKNNEISIKEVSFSEPKLEECNGLVVEVPANNEEYYQRFGS